MIESLIFNFAKILGFIVGNVVKPKVVFILHSTAIGGAERVHLDIIELLAKNNLKVLAVTKSLKSNVNFDQEFKIFCNLIRLKIDSLYKNDRIFVGFLSGISKVKTVKNVIGGATYDFYRCIPYLKNKRIIEIFHAYQDGHWGFDKERLKYINMINDTVCISPDIYKDFLSENIINKNESNNVHLIRNKINVFESKKKPNHKYKNVYFIGRNSEEKRLELFIRLIKLVKQDKVLNERYRFTILTNHFNEIERIDEVEYCTFNNNRNCLAFHYSNLDILVITSKIEGHPIVLDEAIANGGIVIAPNVGGIASIKSTNLYTFNSLSDNSIHSQILSYLKMDLKYDKGDSYLQTLISNNDNFDKLYLELIGS